MIIAFAALAVLVAVFPRNNRAIWTYGLTLPFALTAEPEEPLPVVFGGTGVIDDITSRIGFRRPGTDGGPRRARFAPRGPASATELAGATPAALPSDDSPQLAAADLPPALTGEPTAVGGGTGDSGGGSPYFGGTPSGGGGGGHGPVVLPEDPADTVPPPVAALPEPGTWAMMLCGFAFVGFSMRQQRLREAQPAA